MASGVPLISSGVGGAKEIISDNNTGLLFRAGDSNSLSKAILTLISNAIEYENIARSGCISTFQSFDVKRSAVIIEKLFAREIV